MEVRDKKTEGSSFEEWDISKKQRTEKPKEKPKKKREKTVPISGEPIESPKKESSFNEWDISKGKQREWDTDIPAKPEPEKVEDEGIDWPSLGQNVKQAALGPFYQAYKEAPKALDLLGTGAKVTPEFTLEMAKGMFIDFPAHFGAVVYHGIRESYRSPEVSEVTGEEWTRTHEEKHTDAMERVDRFVRQMDRGFRFIRYPFQTIRDGQPPPMDERTQEALEPIGVMFELPRDVAFDPIGKKYGELVGDKMAGQMTTEALDALFWTIAPYYTYKGVSKARKKHHKKKVQERAGELEAIYQERFNRERADLAINRQQLADTLARERDIMQTREVRAEVAKAERQAQREYEARHDMYENLFSESNVSKFLDDVEAWIDERPTKDRPISSKEINDLTANWMERMNQEHVGLEFPRGEAMYNTAYRRWRAEKAELDRRGVYPIESPWDRIEMYANKDPSSLSPARTDLRLGADKGKPHHDTGVTDSVIIPGKKPPRKMREVLKHKGDYTLQQKMRTGKKKNPVEAQADNVANFAEVFSENVNPAAVEASRQAQRTRPDLTIRQREAVDTVRLLRERQSITETGLTQDGRPARVKEADRLALLKESAEKNIPPEKKLTKEAAAERAAQREADAYFDLWGDIPFDESPFRRSTKNPEVRNLSEIFDDLKSLKGDEIGAIGDRPLDHAGRKRQTEAFDRLVGDLQTIVRKAAHDGKPVGQWLIDNQWVVDPQVAQMLQEYAEGASKRPDKGPDFIFEPGTTPVTNQGALTSWFDEMRQPRFAPTKTAKTAMSHLYKALFSVDPDVRFHLGQSLEGSKVYHRKLQALGASTEANMRLMELDKVIYNMPRKLVNILDDLVRARQDLGMYGRLKSRKLPDRLKELGVTDTNQYLATLKSRLDNFQRIYKLTDAEARKVQQSLDDWFTETDRLRQRMYDAGAYPEWLNNLLKQYDYAPTRWLEIVDRAQAMSDAGHKIDASKPPKTITDMRTITDKPEIMGKRLDVESTGIRELTHKPGELVEMKSRNLMGNLLAHTEHWIATNSAMQSLSYFAENFGGRGSPITPAQIKKVSKELKGGRISIQQVDKGVRKMTMPDNRGANTLISTIRAKGKEKSQFKVELTNNKGAKTDLGLFDTLKEAKQRSKEGILYDVYGEGMYTDVPVYKKTPPHRRALHYYEGGVQKTLWADDWFHAQWTNQSMAMKQGLAQVLRIGSGAAMTRYFATGPGNPLFAFASLPMDAMHIFTAALKQNPDGSKSSLYSMYTPVAAGQMATDIAAVLPDVVGRKGRWRDYFREGGGMPFLTQSDVSPLALGRASRSWRHVNDYMAYLQRTAELTMRIAHRERLIKEGYEPWEATIMARDRLDYAQGGSVIKVADLMIPYTNASAQSMRGVGRAAKEAPGQTAFKTLQLSAAAFMMDSMTRHFFPDLQEKIPPWTQVGYWTIPTGAVSEDIWGGKIDHMIRIRQDPTQTITTTAGRLLSAAAHGDEVQFRQLWLAMADMTPLAQKAPNLPPVLEALVAYTRNVDPLTGEQLYRGPPVEPEEEWTPGKTSKMMKDLSDMFGMSPDRLQGALDQLFTSNNLMIEPMTRTYDFIHDNVEEEEWQKVVTDFMVEVPASKSLLHSVRTGPSIPKQEEMVQPSLEDRAIRRNMSIHLNRLLEGHFLNEEVPYQEISGFIRKQGNNHGEDVADWLMERTELFQQLMEINSDNRNFWMALQGDAYTPTGRGQWLGEYFAKNTEDEEYIGTLWRDIDALAESKSQIVPKGRNTDFWQSFEDAYYKEMKVDE